MLKRLWMIFGPVLIAGLLVLLLIFFYPTSKSYNLSKKNDMQQRLVHKVLEKDFRKESSFGPKSTIHSFLVLVSGFDLIVCI